MTDVQRSPKWPQIEDSNGVTCQVRLHGRDTRFLRRIWCFWSVALHGDADFVIPCVEKQLTGVVNRRLALKCSLQNFSAAPQANTLGHFRGHNDFER
jgi:hypothetical protein